MKEAMSSPSQNKSEIRGRVQLPPSECTMLFLANPLTPDRDTWAVVCPDGRRWSDFRSSAAATIVQRCFYDRGIAPTEPTAFLLVERFFWLRSPIRIVYTESSAAHLLDDGGVKFVAPSLTFGADGFTARFWAKQPELTALAWIEVEVTPDYVEYSVQRPRYGTFAASDDSAFRSPQPVPLGTPVADLLSPPKKVRF